MNSKSRPMKKSNNSIMSGSNVICTLLVLCSLILFGIVFSAFMMPNEDQGGPGTNSNIFVQDSRTMREKILEWLPKHHSYLLDQLPEGQEPLPDFTKEMWTPIDVDVSSDPLVTLCRLNFKEYYQNPHKYSMFRDLVNLSKCMGSNRRREKLSVLKAEMSAQGIKPLEPTGFFFHESRVGSTLVANLLGSDPWSLVFSESTPPANAILHCDNCDRSRHIQLIRDIFSLMCRSPYHKRIFFKFQSITTTKMDLVLEAFPNTPWGFLYRNPVQTMMSHLDPKKDSTGAPCLRSMRSPPDEVQATLKKVLGSGATPTKEAWCSAHLNMLCSSAVAAFDQFSNYSITNSNRANPRGFLINYESLPGIIPTVILPHFGVEVSPRWRERMAEESVNYSKGRSTSRKFESDSADKEERATAAIQKYSTAVLQSNYEIMVKKSLEGIQMVSPSIYASLTSSGRINWDILKPIHSSVSVSHANKKDNLEIVNSPAAPAVEEAKVFAASEDTYPHSLLPKIEYFPWAPFANTHNSKPFERVHCPMYPDANYPKTYNLRILLDNWNTDSTVIPPVHYDSLCHFNYQNETELAAAFRYQKAERPFIMYNIPEVDAVAKKWSDVDYLQHKLGKKKYRTESSKDNHFMYWRGNGNMFLRGKDGKKWTPPTSVTAVKYEDWLQLAVKGQNTSLENRTHQYFRVSSDMGNEWLFNELPFFKPVKSLFLVDPKEQRGIHCRFGMRSVIAEAHFDGGRNAVVLLGGLRRWIMTHPDQCSQMYMIPNGHPSARHSEVDWSKPDYDKYKTFATVQANEVILQAGDMLWVPTFWIHYITSLNINYQCNSRSGRTNVFNKALKDCGF